jgi:DNA-binding GntR family transcriptional regulator
MNTPLTNRKPQGLTDWAYDRIKDSILNLVLPPGTQLQVELLATQMGISRTPVREALLRLERDGFVQVIPRVGFFVTEADPKDLEDLYDLRELLESRAILDGVPIMTDEDLDHLKYLLALNAEAVKQENLEAFLESEIEFHAFLTSRSRNKRLISALESFRDLTYRWRKVSVKSIDDVKVSLEEHQKVFEAVQRRDAQLASQLMSEHICAAENRILLLINHLRTPVVN